MIRFFHGLSLSLAIGALAACGATVAIHYHSGEDRAKALLAEIEKEGGKGAIFRLAA